MVSSIKKQKIGEERLNKQGCLMKIIEYNNKLDIVVEFQDEYRAKVHTNYSAFNKNSVRNPYYPSVYGVGMIGNKYSMSKNSEDIKEYKLWHSVMLRCYDSKYSERYPTYKDVTCCKEWLLFENFYEWLHSQPNFEKWLNSSNHEWHLDKDILVKNSKIYSPSTCCLVPQNVNLLFAKLKRTKELPVGVKPNKNRFQARCQNPFTGNRDYLGSYSTKEQAFEAFKKYKEILIKQVAEIEYSKGNITKQCYDAMMCYEVEIDD